MVDQVERDTRGVLHPAEGLDRFTLVRHAPADEVVPFLDRYWIVSWDLPHGVTHTQQVLIHPVVNVVFEGGSGTVSGPQRRRFTRTLSGSGRAVGVMSRPGGFGAMYDGSVADLTDKTVPIGAVFGEAGDRLARDVALVDREQDVVDVLDAWFIKQVASAPHPATEVADIAGLIASDRTVRTVAQVAQTAGVSVRQLQRLFAENVGVSPRWVIRRYRIYDVAERVAHGDAVHWAELAAELGYSDQAHLTRDFTATVGMSPAAYARHAATATMAAR